MEYDRSQNSGITQTQYSTNSTKNNSNEADLYGYIRHVGEDVSNIERRIQALEEKSGLKNDNTDKLIKSISRLSDIVFWILIWAPIITLACIIIVFWITKPNSPLIHVAYVIVGLIGVGVFVQAIRLPDRIKNIEKEIESLKRSEYK